MYHNIITFSEILFTFNCLRCIYSSYTCDVIHIKLSVMEPRKLELEEGEALDVTCTLTDSDKSLHNSSQIVFLKIGRYEVGHPYFHVVDRQTARLHVPMASYQHWHGIILCNVSGSNHKGPIMLFDSRRHTAVVFTRKFEFLQISG